MRLMMKKRMMWLGLSMVAGLWTWLAQAAESVKPVPAAPAQIASKGYVLNPNDLIHLKVYQEDDLESKVRLTPEGVANLPLLGGVKLGGKTVEEARIYIHNELAKDYLVSPHVELTVVEYAKRKFILFGEIQKPGAYEMPGEESINLLDAIAMAGGGTAKANLSKVTVVRKVGEEKKQFILDAKAMAQDTKTKLFVILPGDTISVPESFL